MSSFNLELARKELAKKRAAEAAKQPPAKTAAELAYEAACNKATEEVRKQAIEIFGLVKEAGLSASVACDFIIKRLSVAQARRELAKRSWRGVIKKIETGK